MENLGVRASGAEHNDATRRVSEAEPTALSRKKFFFHKTSNSRTFVRLFFLWLKKESTTLVLFNLTLGFKR
jgi:hypothetical protein